ncbi:MAG: family 43 glycosylhydrolase [Clostridia bacterium]|nr:family 43 glycosylhydrolase [Clostridia bacterium]
MEYSFPEEPMYKRYCKIMITLAPLRLRQEPEYLKTVSVIDALANRAYDIAMGAKPGIRFGFAFDHYTTESLFGRAEELLDALKNGEFPLQGKYTEPGAVAVVDHDFVEKDGVMHVFYNRAFVGHDWPERFVDTFGHAVSEDLIHWTPCPPVFSAQEGGFDDYQVWSPGFIQRGGKYYMFYTGVNYNIAQAICMAESEDLVHWTRCADNPVFIPGSWAPWSADKWSDCRDGMVFGDDGRYYLYYCTSRYMDDGSIHNAMGIATSDDLYHWKDEGAFTIPNCNHMPESPYVFKRRGTYYMIFTNCGKGIAYATSKYPDRGWEVLPDDRNLLFPGSTAEVIEFKGKWYISNTLWHGTGEQYLELAEITWNDDGTFTVGQWLR